ncbi:hypothetical protein ACFFX0_16780 [Citricoccus parietis]|uniref:Uncharacterized protein n=1 Tax=Citricoccus parietis TaxID=592307 RepID=A0ABV5G2R3_9MICC
MRSTASRRRHLRRRQLQPGFPTACSSSYCRCCSPSGSDSWSQRRSRTATSSTVGPSPVTAPWRACRSTAIRRHWPDRWSLGTPSRRPTRRAWTWTTFANSWRSPSNTATRAHCCRPTSS